MLNKALINTPFLIGAFCIWFILYKVISLCIVKMRYKMTSNELVKLLNKNERSQAWLSRKLNYTAMAVCKWCKGDVMIPDRQVPIIRDLLK